MLILAINFFIVNCDRECEIYVLPRNLEFLRENKKLLTLVRSPNAALLRVLALLSTFSSATRFLLRGGLMGCS